MNKQRYFFLLFLIGYFFSFAQEKKYYFYKPLPYGSEAVYNPLTLLINGGFDTFNMLDREPLWRNVYWNNAATNVWRCINAP